MDSTTYELLKPDVVTAAKTTARQWPGTIDEEDAEQEIWALLIEAPKSIDVLSQMERPNRVSTLTLYGHRVAARYRDDYELFSGNYLYSTDYVRRLLDADILVFSGDRPDKLTFSEWVDITEAFAKVQQRNAGYADLIARVFIQGEKLQSGADRMQLTRAVDSLTKEMNRVHTSRVLNYTEGPGTRRVMSNTQAEYYTAEQTGTQVR
jgi:hypothetical protein